MVLGISGVVWSVRLVHTRFSCPFGLWVGLATFGIYLDVLNSCYAPMCVPCVSARRHSISISISHQSSVNTYHVSVISHQSLENHDL